MMEHVKLDSSSLYSMAHDATGLEVRFHGKGCKVNAKQPCDCNGSGDLYHYPGVGKDLHEYLMLAPSLGAAFATKVKGAKHLETGKPLYPHVKRIPD